MNWKVKAFLQKILSTTPGGRDIYYFGQKSFGRFRTVNLSSRIKFAQKFVETYRSVFGDFLIPTSVEIGTGWAPVIPIFFWLCGVDNCETYDVNPFLRDELVTEAATQILVYLDQTENQDNKYVISERVNCLKQVDRTPHTILDLCSIRYHAPAKATEMEHRANSIQLVYSNLVLGDIPENELYKVLKETYRILKVGGATQHIIDLNDQFSQGDPSISPINFLQYSDQEFAKYNSKICYQNRLRAPMYKRIIEESGLQIKVWEERINQSAIKSLPYLNIDKKYQEFSSKDLCISSINVLAIK